ncbi:hypothetical protein RR46_02168 [Papilio xuthus]|uniref:Uncharacterized protein n=1 Tax=Papilio xuthus TaxID=66420 RepID=A0A194QJ58_PAPXU|nr:hypothetical protein RR46_02168 [Papilio xuthus]
MIVRLLSLLFVGILAVSVQNVEGNNDNEARKGIKIVVQLLICRGGRGHNTSVWVSRACENRPDRF